ncbi:response regulator transcription factor [Texcoconibacillus texcoconensis]|uniref:Two-component system response regulator NreC n=1 Tax=Texcoconibacillus texcoconensis TaxID=1095777 RepID=A0A840QPL2_9BACI|nr:response regulator transcription factor [Texcoconibacillus texcoconensis]MBB5173271.1 two-component system response regulator NreC [Texcoconibacillus texcoconensis]
MKIILADSEAVFRYGLSQLLNDLFTVEALTSVDHFSHLYEQVHRYTFDIIFLDVELEGGGDVFGAVQQLRSIPTHHRIIVTSRDDNQEMEKQAYMAGADGFLEKRVSLDEAIDDLQKIHDGEKVFYLDRYRFRSTENNLTQREKEVFRLTVYGYTINEIADIYNIATKTVENHRRNIRKKLGVKTKKEWITKAKEIGLINF